jgi:hypothetical protein
MNRERFILMSSNSRGREKPADFPVFVRADRGKQKGQGFALAFCFGLKHAGSEGCVFEFHHDFRAGLQHGEQ